MESQPSLFYHNAKQLSDFEKLQRSSSLYLNHAYTGDRLVRRIKELQINCAVNIKPLVRPTKIKEHQSMGLLKSITCKTTRENLQSLPPARLNILILCALILVDSFVENLKLNASFWERFKRRPFAHALKYFQLLCYKLIPEQFSLLIEQIMRFFKTEHLWNAEFICCEILSMLASYTSTTVVLRTVLDHLEDDLLKNNLREARHVNGVLEKMLHQPIWSEHQAGDCVNLIRLYHTSVLETDVTNSYYKMRRGFEMCLILMCDAVRPSELMIMISFMFDLCFSSELEQEALTNFGHTLEEAITLMKVESIAEITDITKNFEYLLNVIASDNPQKSRIGTRLMARLFDRQKNFAEFQTPRSFLPTKYYNINISPYYEKDKELLKLYRVKIQDNLLLAVRQHQIADNLDIIFTILCTIVVGVPCGFTAAMAVAIVLEIQEFALTLNNHTSSIETNQMHAVVIGVIMLTAWVHRASSLSIYVQKILNRRSDEAPHLNPPIKLEYQYAYHHVIWNEPKLFFDFWQLWYGLWKRFRTHEPQILIQSEKLLLREAGTGLSTEGHLNHTGTRITLSNVTKE